MRWAMKSDDETENAQAEEAREQKRADDDASQHADQNGKQDPVDPGHAHELNPLQRGRAWLVNRDIVP